MPSCIAMKCLETVLVIGILGADLFTKNTFRSFSFSLATFYGMANCCTDGRYRIWLVFNIKLLNPGEHWHSVANSLIWLFNIVQ